MNNPPICHRLRLPLALGILLASLAAPAVASNGTNALPQAESFEAYADGTVISQVPGWSLGALADNDTGRVTTNATALAALAVYTNDGGGLPFDTTHTKVLGLNGPVAQRVSGAEGRLVRIDCLLMPARSEDLPTSDPTMRMALSFDTNGQAVVFQRDTTLGTNLWLTLTNSPTIPTQSWVRVTVLQDEVNHMFQLRLNDGAPIPDDQGWSISGPGGTQPGAWFAMQVTNGAMAEVALDGGGEAYLDDLEIVTDLPAVQTLPATNIMASSADFVGYLSFTGLAQTAVEVYWGTTDGGTNAEVWANTNGWAAPQAPGRLVYAVTNIGGALVYYRFAASNDYGHVWAGGQSAIVNLGEITVTSFDAAANERPVDSGTFRITRPAWAAVGDRTVAYAMSGTAANGADYAALSGSATIPDGATSVDIVLTPLIDAVTEPLETAILTLLPGDYVLGSPTSATVDITDAYLRNPLTWNNASGDGAWNLTSENWDEGGTFYPLDTVRFNAAVDAATGRVYVGSATWTGTGWTNAVPKAVAPARLMVTSGTHEFEGGAVTLGPVEISGSSSLLIDRNLGLQAFGGGLITLKGGEFRRQIPPDAVSQVQTLSNDLLVSGSAGLDGCRGTNYWTGRLELRTRLNVGSVAPVASHVHVFQGAVTLNQETNAGQRALAFLAGGGSGYVDGPIVDDTNATHTAAWPLFLGVGGASTGPLTLRGTNTYGYGTVITNFGGAVNGVVVAAGSCLGTGAVSVAAGAMLTVQATGGVWGALSIATNATVTLAVDGAVLSAVTSVTNGGLLVLKSGNCLPDQSTLWLYGNVDTGSNSNLVEDVGDLYLNGVRQLGGTYRGQANHVLGSGALRVRGDPPTGYMILVR